jgi:hypothetical protein
MLTCVVNVIVALQAVSVLLVLHSTLHRCNDSQTMLTLSLRWQRRIWLNGRAATAPFAQKHGRHDEDREAAARERLILTKDFD